MPRRRLITGPCLLALAVLGLLPWLPSQQGGKLHPAKPAVGEPRVAEPVQRTRLLPAADRERLERWQHFAQLRDRLRLPNKVPSAEVLRWQRPEVAAMRRIATGVQAARDAVTVTEAKKQTAVDPALWQQFVRERDEQILQYFGAAIALDLASVDALLALANTVRDTLLASLALRSIEPRPLLSCATERTVSLLAALLEHQDPEVAERAFMLLAFLLDAGVADGGLSERLARRAKDLWPVQDQALLVGAWNPAVQLPPESALALALPAPADLPSRLVVLSALSGDEALLQRLLAGKCDPRILLQCHRLAAPRVSKATAAQLFGWYRNHPPKWPKEPRAGVNAWEFGVLATLVSVLPQLPEQELAFYDRHLVQGMYGQTAKELALLRLGCRQRDLGHNWFDVFGGCFHAMAPIDALHLWHALAAAEAWTLVGCLQVLPQCSDADVTDDYGGRVRRAAPLALAELELELLQARWLTEQPAIARAVARRALRHGSAGHEAVQRWLRDATRDANRLATTALELAIEFGIPLPKRAWAETQPEQRILQQLHDAYFAVESEPLNALLQQPDEDARGAYVRAALSACVRLSQWSKPLARWVAQHTTHGDPDTRRAAYLALACDGAAGHEEAQLANERRFDLDLDVRGDG